MVRSEALVRAFDRGYLYTPDLTARIIRERGQLTAHQDVPAALANLARGRLPHHARTFAREFETLDERLADRTRRLAGGRSNIQRTPQCIAAFRAKIEPFDTLGCPIR